MRLLTQGVQAPAKPESAPQRDEVEMAAADADSAGSPAAGASRSARGDAEGASSPEQVRQDVSPSFLHVRDTDILLSTTLPVWSRARSLQEFKGPRMRREREATHSRSLDGGAW